MQTCVCLCARIRHMLTPRPLEIRAFASLPPAAQRGLSEGRGFESGPKVGDCSLSGRKRRRGRKEGELRAPSQICYFPALKCLALWLTHSSSGMWFPKFFWVWFLQGKRCSVPYSAADATLPAAPPRSWGCARGTVLEDDAFPSPGLHPAHFAGFKTPFLPRGLSFRQLTHHPSLASKPQAAWTSFPWLMPPQSWAKPSWTATKLCLSLPASPVSRQEGTRKKQNLRIICNRHWWATRRHCLPSALLVQHIEANSSFWPFEPYR